MLIVTTPAASFDLTTLETVRSEFGVTDHSEDENLRTWIRQASDVISKYCNRVFARETISETVRRATRSDDILLSRYPVSSIVSVVENGVTLAAADYEVRAESGLLTKLSNDEPACWSDRQDCGHVYCGDREHKLRPTPARQTPTLLCAFDRSSVRHRARLHRARQSVPAERHARSAASLRGYRGDFVGRILRRPGRRRLAARSARPAQGSSQARRELTRHAATPPSYLPFLRPAGGRRCGCECRRQRRRPSGKWRVLGLASGAMTVDGSRRARRSSPDPRTAIAPVAAAGLPTWWITGSLIRATAACSGIARTGSR